MFKNTGSEPIKKKADLTKERVYAIAMQMIRNRGFEATTMRAIAEEAGVAPSGIYYYFESKEALVHQYYQQLHKEHLAAVGDFLATEQSFERRLHYIVTTKIQTALPHKKIAVALFRVAANPESPMSPFSEDSRALREEVMEVLREVVNGSQDKFHPDIGNLLPEYLWLYMMGVILFWIFDPSKEAQRTLALIDRTVPLISSLNQTIQSPLAAPFRKRIIDLLKTFSLNSMSGEKQ